MKNYLGILLLLFSLGGGIALPPSAPGIYVLGQLSGRYLDSHPLQYEPIF